MSRAVPLLCALAFALSLGACAPRPAEVGMASVDYPPPPPRHRMDAKTELESGRRF
jgi:hypothetical protein